MGFVNSTCSRAVSIISNKAFGFGFHPPLTRADIGEEAERSAIGAHQRMGAVICPIW